MVWPAAKKDYALDHMVSKTTAPEMEMQGKGKGKGGPGFHKHKFRGNKTGKYEKTAGSKTKLPNLK